MSLRIGMILDNDFPPDSRVESEAVSLIEAGFEVFLFSITYKNLPADEQIRGIQVRRYPASQFVYKLSALAYTFPFYHWAVANKIKDFLDKNRIQVIHVHDMLIVRAVWKANRTNLPIVLDLHENRPAIMRSYRHVNTIQGRMLIYPGIWEKFLKKYITAAQEVIVVTELARNQIVEKGEKAAEKVTVVPNTVHADIFFNYPIVPEIVKRYEDYFTILYLGDTGLRRGTDTAIKATALLVHKIPNLKLVFVGKNRQDPVLKKMAKDLNLEDIVDFEGWQDVSLFPSYIKASKVCISPLKRNEHHDTTFANKVFQYMAVGAPLVVSDCPPQAEVVRAENAGFVHEADNEEDLADKIYTLYNSDSLRDDFSKNAKNGVEERWQWKKTSKNLIEMYKRWEQSLASDSGH